MKKIILSLGCAIVLSACATTGPQIHDFDEARSSVKVAIMPVDVEVSFAKVGSKDVRADWTALASKNLKNSLIKGLQDSGEQTVIYKMTGSASQGQQLTLLQQQVADAMTTHVVVTDPAKFRGQLPHKKGGSQMTYNLGSGVQAIKGSTGADYAAFLTNRTVVESGGSIFTKIAIGTVTGYTPGLSSFKGTYISLVDLNTGDVKWLNAKTAAFGGDPRKPENADKIVNSILEKSPFNEGDES